MNFKKKNYLYVNSNTQKMSILNTRTFLIEDFFHLPPMSTTPMVHLEQRISQRIFIQISNNAVGIIRGLGEDDSWKKPEAKISWHCSFSYIFSMQSLWTNHLTGFSLFRRACRASPSPCPWVFGSLSGGKQVF